uniref:Protein amnionless n=1 Tax=Fundulus heteroclitus TaxID=8078 RepID=A0A3Q2P6U6_FUNHE
MSQVLLIFCLAGATDALYKQWIPDTNYENKTNWDKGDVPCGNDRVQFSSQRKVSVFVETSHAVQEMTLPMDGEMILNSGAGFYVLSGQDPGCGAGVRTKFKDSESLRWFNPALWQAAATLNDLQDGHFLFSVHEESVPCQQDDVIFKVLSSFRVDTSSSQTTIPVKSVSVLGKVFDSRSEFSEYLGSGSGQFQFHGSSAVTVGNPGCPDPTGCFCGNSVHHEHICSAITCGSSSCKKPLRPVGHCCEVCGAIVTVHYTDGFKLQNFRERIRHLFLSLPQYESIQLGMSKVLKPQRLMGIIPFGSSPEIQVVILDGETGKLSQALAQDMLKDIKSHGSKLGITGADIQTASEPESSVGTVVGAVFGALLVITLIVIVVALIRKGVVQMPPMRNTNVSDLNGATDHGFDNPIFDKPDMLPDMPNLCAWMPSACLRARFCSPSSSVSTFVLASFTAFCSLVNCCSTTTQTSCTED